ncbi:hypothetical protein CEUSTIGMA_g7666.t1 [Chlamydomonas eustigma]|uniref:tRNA (adenine(58)-N(1))-methyltransferase n=1 Tax=Chlamydomonas eustigma TaxID=1157962 RepID=A0A250XAX0_9CHLO|nr:hypothetical protein CEUSTIGMA_g7666.t1 [Chlamydomonas eustigma]|eukprot:GAX80228.1 hypothetical protein CEUSTIGMA_g7666.t1 [Chlamydomonas eustigma]
MYAIFRDGGQGVANTADSGAARSLSVSDRNIRTGDLVIVYESPQAMKAVTITENGRYDNRFGNFAMKDWIGKPYGSKVYGKGGKGWVTLLEPTPELWTLVLRHRTQILYIADISMICFNLELKPGHVVLESGTGSASLTHSLARAVAPGGHVYTYEFHKERADEARKELEAHRLQLVVTVTHRDIMALGFPVLNTASAVKGQPVISAAPPLSSTAMEVLAASAPEVMRLEDEGATVNPCNEVVSEADAAAQLSIYHDGNVDAIFLDLPGPWKVVENAARCLKPNGRFCSFSPCIEQVQRTSEELRRHGFTDMHTVEVLLREYEVSAERLYECSRSTGRDVTVHEPGSLQLRNISNADENTLLLQDEAAPLQERENLKEEQDHAGSYDDAKMTPRIRNHIDSPRGVEVDTASKADSQSHKRRRTEEHGHDDEAASCLEAHGPAHVNLKATRGPKAALEDTKTLSFHTTSVLCRPCVKARGHTGYLIFARKFV